jgi:hypothetical protein
MKRITDVLLCFTWDDGKSEFMYENLPEYLFDDINTYLNELEEHREEVGEDYNFTKDEQKRGSND